MKKSNAWNRQRKSEPIKNSGMDFVNKQNSGHESTTGSTTVPKPLFRHSMKAFSLAPNNRLNKLGNGPISRVNQLNVIRSKQTTGQNVSIPMIHRGSVTTKHSKAESLPNQNSTKFFNVRGKTAPKSSDLQGTPGPGTYNRDLEIGGVSYVIGRGKRCHDRKQLSLGPGSYEISPCPSRISYTMTPRRKEMKRTEIVPGPGAYTPSELEDGIKFSISKANRNRARSSESPGPGAYSITTRNSSRSALTIKSQRPPLSQIIDTPGPGTYHYELKIGGPEPSLRSKHEFKSKSIEPGPGSYTPSLLSQTAPSWGFGSSTKRLKFNDYTVPDPSWYHSRTNSRK